MATTSYPTLVSAYLPTPLRLRFGLEDLAAKPLILLPLTQLHQLHHLRQGRSLLSVQDSLRLALNGRTHP